MSVEGWESRQSSKSMPAETELEVGSLLNLHHRTGSIKGSLTRTALLEWCKRDLLVIQLYIGVHFRVINQSTCMLGPLYQRRY